MENISGPRAFSIKAVKIQRKSGMTWKGIVLDWLYAYIVNPIQVATGCYDWKLSNWMISDAIRCSQSLGYQGWWSLPPNWSAKWSARKAWGNSFTQ